MRVIRDCILPPHAFLLPRLPAAPFEGKVACQVVSSIRFLRLFPPPAIFCMITKSSLPFLLLVSPVHGGRLIVDVEDLSNNDQLLLKLIRQPLLENVHCVCTQSREGEGKGSAPLFHTLGIWLDSRHGV